jgi:hypothetical protein
MLPLLQEYRAGHPRFREHLAIALVMALMAPACAIVLFRTTGWWNPWLWASCGVGIALALCIASAVILHRKPRGISRLGERLVERSAEWFPYFFVIMQSAIASLIVIFLWFSISSLILKVPTYVHAMLVTLALLIPARRYVWARISYTAPRVYEQWDEILRATWYILATIFGARSILALALGDNEMMSSENSILLIIIWVPALLFILFTAVSAAAHLRQGAPGVPTRPRPDERMPEQTSNHEIIDRF